MKEETLRVLKDGHIAECLLTFAMYAGARNIKEIPGIWEKQINEQWTIKCNGHKEEMEFIPPFSWAIEFNGWPAGLIDVMGEGILCGGELANEETLRAALVKFVNESQ